MRDRKLAEPAAPKRLPDEPLPNAAPMSAPLPCCSSTNPQIAAATSSARPTATFPACSSLLHCRAPPAVRPARSPEIPRPSSDAPPIRPPSISAIANSASRVVGLDAPAVQQRHVRRRCSCASRARSVACTACACCRRRRPPGADRPHRLVGDDDRAAASAAARPHGVELPQHDRLRSLPASRSAQRFADARDRRQPRRQRRCAPSADDRRSVSPKILRGARVTDDRVAAAEFDQHRRRHFAGDTRPPACSLTSSRAPRDRRARERRLRLRQIRVRHAHRELAPGGACPSRRASRPAAPRSPRARRSSSSCRRRVCRASRMAALAARNAPPPPRQWRVAAANLEDYTAARQGGATRACRACGRASAQAARDAVPASARSDASGRQEPDGERHRAQRRGDRHARRMRAGCRRT